MKLSGKSSFVECVYLTMNGLAVSPEAAADLPPERRAALVEVAQMIKERERAELLQAIAKGFSG